MTPEIAQNALIFLARSDLKGQEVLAFVAVCQALEAIVTAKPTDANSKAPKKAAKQEAPK